MPRKKPLRTGAYIQHEVSIKFMGFDFLAEIEIRVTTFGQGPTGLSGPPEFSDPGWGAEWEVDGIILSLDEPHRVGPGFEATGALFECLAKHFEPEIDQAIANYEPPEPDREYDEDYYRGDR